ncbi:MAG: uracil-DNA glycosylase [Desulfobacterales bacterium]|nr:uracil-DNA glycosylase [Desulfobacterales bacterium]
MVRAETYYGRAGHDQDPGDILEKTSDTLRYMAEAGCTGFDCPEKTIGIVKNLDRNLSSAADDLKELRSLVGDCQRCKLCKERTNIVFGTGDPDARLVFVGEGPGHDEDQQGEPFVGKAGQLLTKIIEAMNLTRDKVYICNIIKCRPPGNRNPAPDEIKACFLFLERQLDAIRPDFICALGTFATQTLLDADEPISKMRGRLYDYRGMKVMPTYHPAYLLRNPEKKRDVWEDMKKLMSMMDV